MEDIRYRWMLFPRQTGKAYAGSTRSDHCTHVHTSLRYKRQSAHLPPSLTCSSSSFFFVIIIRHVIILYLYRSHCFKSRGFQSRKSMDAAYFSGDRSQTFKAGETTIRIASKEAPNTWCWLPSEAVYSKHAISNTVCVEALNVRRPNKICSA